VIDIEGVEPAQAAALQAAGISTTQALLKKAGNPQGRESLAGMLHVSPTRVLDWVNRADLMRIRGVGAQYADLLEAAGVDSVKELAQRRPDNLYLKLTEVNERKRLVRRPPSEHELRVWIATAQRLGAVVSR
jgi:predicted flap endonuclease-1-like 5' DNA nuclease